MVDFEFETEGDFVPGSTTEWDVFQMLPGTDPPVYLATLYEAREKSIRVELNGPGSGSFAINRTSPECTEAILAQGNLVKVRIPEIHDDYIFAFFIETGDFTLISSEERGGEMLTFGGRGILSYLEYARAWSESYIDGGQDPEAGLWRAYAAGTGSAPGQILRRLLEEFQDPDRPQQPLPHLTIDFDYDDDSTADAWDTTDATDEFTYQVGEDGLAILLRLLETEAIRVQMDPDFLLHAYNVDNLGRDLAGDTFGADVVRFERGVNIATELRREVVETRVATHILVQGEDDKYGSAALADATDRVTKEAFLAGFGTGTTALNAIGAVDLQERLNVSDLITLILANRRTADVVLSDPVSIGSPLGPVATDGFYLPGPEGTNGDFWVGDTVRLHTGAGAFDYTEVDAVVQAITITRDDDNAELIVVPEIKAGSPSETAHVYMVSFLIQRSNTTFGPDIVPRGSTAGIDPFFDPWTHLGSGYCGFDGPFDYPFDLAYLDVDSNGWPMWTWGGDIGLNGSSRPTGQSLQIRGACGPPVILEQLDLQFGGTNLDAPVATAPADGIMFALFSGRIGGDPSGSAFTLDAPGDATVLANTMASANPLDSGFFPRALLAYKTVTAGENVTWEVTSNMAVDWGCMVAFVPGGSDLEIVDFVLTGTIGSALTWTWPTDSLDIEPGGCA